MTQYHLRIAASAEDLARQTAEQVASRIALALAERDRAQIAG
jgi:6-phosphogluconolactonase